MSQTGDGRDGDEIPPGALLFVGLLVVWAMPKGSLLQGNFTDITALIVLGAAIVAIAVFFASLYISKRHGLNTGVEWLISPGIGVHSEVEGRQYTEHQHSRGTPEATVMTSSEPAESDRKDRHDDDIGYSPAEDVQIIEWLRRNINGHEFEDFVAELWESRGWDARVTSGSSDGNIDVIAEDDMPTGDKKNREMIQAKHKSEGNKVGPGTVRKTKGSERVQPRDNIVVVTTGTFTQGAKDAAQKMVLN